MPLINRQVRLLSRPVGIPQAENFEIVEAPVEELPNGTFLVQNLFLSVDPAMRGWVSGLGNYSAPVGLGEVMRSFAVGQIIKSRDPDFPVGEHVMGMFGWQHFAVARKSDVIRRVRDLDLPLSTALGVLGLNGITAYLGLLECGSPKAGDTVVVSTAAGGVGSCVGQVAKVLGCRTVGIAGGAVKTGLCLSEFGYDMALDYKAEPNLAQAIAATCPNGVNVYFDNTAGDISDAVLPQLAIGARVVICGTAAISNWDPPPTGPRVERHLLIKRARMQGFLFFDHADRFEEAASQLAQWVRSGQLRYQEDILEGIEEAPGSIAGLYRGENLGKRLIRL